MGILDDAIRQHLDLKRRHGARESELRDIEDQAFGSGDRPDPFAAGELFGEVAATADTEAEERTRLVEPEGPPAVEAEASSAAEPVAPPGPAGTPEPPTPAPPEPSLPPPEPPAPAAEPEESTPSSEPLVPPPGEAPPPPEPSGEPEPEQPLESESLEELMVQEEEPGPSASAAPEEAPPAAPAEPNEVVPPSPAAAEPEESEPSGPEGGVPDPPPPPPEPGEEPAGRARGRVNVPTQEFAPPDEGTGEVALPLEPQAEDESEPAGPQLYDFETDEDELVSEPGQPAVDEGDDFEALGPVEEEADYLEEEEPYAEGAGGVAELPAEETDERELVREEDEEKAPGGAPDDEDDILSGSPEFVEEDTESEGLWFEEGPPQDFDFEEEEEEK
jgi:hypothetical protein